MKVRMKKASLLLVPVMAVALVAAPPVALQAQAAPAKAKISSVKVKGTTITVKVKKAKGAKKYQYKASTSRSFTPAQSISTSKRSASFKYLNVGTYYIKARAQFKQGKKNVWGKWSAVKSAAVSGSGSNGSVASKPVTISYDLDGGTLPAGTKTTLSQNDPYYELPTPTRDGYDFDGWVDSNGYSVSAVSYGDGNTTVHAKWTKKIKITYVLNGGTLPDNAKTEVGASEGWWYDLPTPTNPDSSYVFGGWYTTPTFSDGSYVSSVAYGDGDTTVYARWTKKIKITYVLNGGTLPQGTQSELTEEEYYYALPTPTNSDSTLLFAGWYTSPTFSEDSAVDTVLYSGGDVTVYAKWSPKVRKITYVTNGGTLPSYTKTTIEYGDYYMLPEPTRAGYDFDGWYTNAKFDPNSYEVMWDYDQGDVTFYAKWSQQES